MDASTQSIRNQIAALLPRLRRFALGLTGNPADADDLVQDAVERALRSLHQWQQGTRLDSWMFRITQNLWIDAVRARRVRAVVAHDPEAAEKVAVDGAENATAMTVTANGPNARIPPHAPDLLAGRSPGGGLDAHAIQPYYTGLIARAAGMEVTVALEGDTVRFHARSVAPKN